MSGDFLILNMDDFRKAVTPHPSYSDSEREIVYRSLVYLAGELARSGKDVIIDATGHKREWRQMAREMIPQFMEVFIECPVEECIKREQSRKERHGAPKGIYEKAKEGWPVPGMKVPYEEPLNPDVVIEYGTSARDAADKIWSCFKRLFIT